MLAVYLGHPLTAPTREGIEQNRANAAKWAAWLWRQGFAVECSWIVATGELEETEANRELGLRSDCEQVKRQDVMVLCGPRISGDMLREAGSAKIIVDFTCYGLDLPSADLEWRDGAPIRLADMEKIVAGQEENLYASKADVEDGIRNRRTNAHFGHRLSTDGWCRDCGVQAHDAPDPVV